MFAVFGVTEQVIEKQVRKDMADFLVEKEIDGELKKVGPNQQEYEIECERLFAHYKSNMKPRVLNYKFGAPETAREYFDATKKQIWNRDLSIKVHCPVLNAKGKPERSKATGKPKMKWITYADYEVQLKKAKAA